MGLVSKRFLLGTVHEWHSTVASTALSPAVVVVVSISHGPVLIDGAYRVCWQDDASHLRTQLREGGEGFTAFKASSMTDSSVDT